MSKQHKCDCLNRNLSIYAGQTDYVFWVSSAKYSRASVTLKKHRRVVDEKCHVEDDHLERWGWHGHRLKCQVQSAIRARMSHGRRLPVYIVTFKCQINLRDVTRREVMPNVRIPRRVLATKTLLFLFFTEQSKCLLRNILRLILRELAMFALFCFSFLSFIRTSSTHKIRTCSLVRYTT